MKNKIDLHNEETYQEQLVSFLVNLGFQLLSRKEILRLRNGKESSALLDELLFDQLQKINPFAYKGKSHRFSENSIRSAIFSLENIGEQDLLAVSKKTFDLLLFGKSFEETVDGEKRSFSLRYIDWDNIANNSFHLAEEFRVTSGGRSMQADVVLFINGIPIVIIEQNASSIKNAIFQHLRHQKLDGGPFRLYRYAPLLLATFREEVRYALTGTTDETWNVWKEKGGDAVSFESLLRNEGRLPTDLDRSLYGLCRPERLMDILSGYILLGIDFRFVSRYYQYFAVKEALKVLTQETPNEGTKGGLIYQTAGTGKNMTMLLLARKILLLTGNSFRILIITNRVIQQETIVYNFQNFRFTAFGPDSGKELVSLLDDNRIPVVVTVFHKLRNIIAGDKYGKSSGKWVIITDDEQTWQGGAFYAELVSLFPNACYFAFMGSPFLKRDKSFPLPDKPILHTYSLHNAIDDNYLLPVYYMRGATTNYDLLLEESVNLLRSREQFIRNAAEDVKAHFIKNLKGTGLKAMLIARDQVEAIKFQKYFEETKFSDHPINAAILISSDMEKEFPKTAIKEYESSILHDFNDAEGETDLIITVDKLLTGFDSPRVAVVYLLRHLKGTQLMQAISRVNRTMQGKQSGTIVDYVDVWPNLLELFNDQQIVSSVEERQEVRSMVITPVTEQIRGIKKEYEDLERLLGIMKKTPEKHNPLVHSRDWQGLFLERLASFERGLRMALSTTDTSSVYSAYEMEVFQNRLTYYKSMEEQVRQLFETEPAEPAVVTKNEPSVLSTDTEALTFYRVIKEMGSRRKWSASEEVMAGCALEILGVMRESMIRDWKRNSHIRKKMENDVEDRLIDFGKKNGIELSFSDIDSLLTALLGILERS